VERLHWNTVLGLKISFSNSSPEHRIKVPKTLVYETEFLVEPLLRLAYRYLAPEPKYVHEPNEEGIKFVNPPAGAHGYDYAYHEAKRLFVQMFGEEEDFLIPMEDDNVEIEESLN